MKTTKEQINKIRELHKEGKNQREISEIMNMPKSTIQYWLSEEKRQRKISNQKKYLKNLSKEKKKELNEKQREYRRNYYKTRYHNDEEYRKRRIELSKNWKKK